MANKNRLLSSTIAVTIFTGAYSNTVQAQVGPSDDIVVTARRERENLRDVPASVSVLTSQTIQQTGAKVATDFIALTSGVSIITATVSPTDTSIQIRGLNRGRDVENNVSLVVDGIMKTNSALLNQPQGALEQVEILKGPQSAIYGVYASAGAIVITTKKPTDALQLDMKAYGATDKTFGGSFILSGPINDTIGFVVSGDYEKTDGYYRNSFLGTPLARSIYPDYKEVNNSTSVDSHRQGNIYGRLLIKPSDATEIDIKAHAGYNNGSSLTFNADFQMPALATAFNDPIFNERVSNHKFVYNSNTVGLSSAKMWDTSFKITQDLDFARLISYVSYNHIKDDFAGGGANGSLFAGQSLCAATLAATAPPGAILAEPFNTYYPIFGAGPFGPSTCDGIQYTTSRQSDVVAEIRLAQDKGPFTWQLGLGYIYIDRRSCLTFQVDSGTGPERRCYVPSGPHKTETMTADTFKTNAYSAFASAEYAVDDKLKLGAGLRYDIEVRDATSDIPTNARTIYVGNAATGFPPGTPDDPANYYLNPGLDPAFNPSGVIAPRHKTFRQMEPKITVAYKANTDLTAYASWGVGFRAGGFNPGGSKAIIDLYFNAPVALGGINAGLAINDAFKKDTTSAFELGVKGKLFGAVNYDVAGFYTDVKDMQFFEFLTGGFGLLRVVSNIDKVRIYGLEGSANWLITQGVSLFGTANWTGSKIIKYSARPYTAGNRVPNAPYYTINVGVQVNRPIFDDVTFNFRTDVRFVGPTPFHTVQDNSVPTIFGLDGNYKNAIRSAYKTVNVSVGLEKHAWSVRAYVTNLFKERYLNEVTVAPEFGGSFVAPGALRRIGVEVGHKF